MTFAKTLLAPILCSATISAILGCCPAAQAATGCQEPKTGTAEIPIFSPPVSEVVKGKGKLQLYSAPNYHCEIKGIFAVPNDHLTTHAQTEDGWSAVTYANPKTGADVSGWVRTMRLKETSAAVAPSQ